VQEKIRKAEKNFNDGKYRKYNVDEFVKELDKRD
jgi:hypothetical protein